MGLVLGIQNKAIQLADQAVAASVVPVTSQLSIPIAAGQTMFGNIYLPFTTAGAAPGIRLNLNTPAAITDFKAGYALYELGAALPVQSVQQVANADFTKVTAAGSFYAECKFQVVNGVNAGNIAMFFAQSVADAAATTLLRGAWMEVTII